MANVTNAKNTGKPSPKSTAPKGVSGKGLAPKGKQPEANVEETPEPKTRVASAKAGTSQKVHPLYFPPENSVSYSSLVAIQESGEEGIDVWDYPLSENFLGRLIRCGLVESHGGRLFGTERTAKILSGEITVTRTRRRSEFDQVIAQMKESTDPAEIAELGARLKELADAQIEKQTERAEKKGGGGEAA